MKNNIDGVLVVEGASDVAYLSGYINTIFFTTGGYDINDKKIEFLNRVSRVNKIIVMTDPDDAGNTIENRIKNKINCVFVAKIIKLMAGQLRKITSHLFKQSGWVLNRASTPILFV